MIIKEPRMFEATSYVAEFRKVPLFILNKRPTNALAIRGNIFSANIISHLGLDERQPRTGPINLQITTCKGQSPPRGKATVWGQSLRERAI